MMKKCFENLNRIEFEITTSCTGKCKHCSQGEHDEFCGSHIDANDCVSAVEALCSEYKIESLMTFGGEPLLFPEDVFKIQKSVMQNGISNRHIITNGYFSI